MANDEVFSSRTSSSSSSGSTGSPSRRDSCQSNPSTPGLDRRRERLTSRKSSQEQDVVKQGTLYIKRPPTANAKLRLKAWQKKFFILRDVSFDNGISTLEMYDSQTAYEAQSSTVEYVLDLKNINNVDSYIESKRFPRAFMVLRSAQSPLVFGTTCDIDKSSWMEAINVLSKKRRFMYSCQDITWPGDKERRSSLPWQMQYKTNPLYTSFPLPTLPRDSSSERPPTPTRTDGPPTPPRNNSIQSNDSGSNIGDFINTKCSGLLVKVQPNSSSNRHRLVGEYYMNVWPGCIGLTTVQSLRERIRWPIEHITKFKSEDLKTGENLVTLEASVYSGPSEGSYLFKTMHGRDLIKKVKDAASSVQYAILQDAPTPPSPIERQMGHLKKISGTPQISTKKSHLHLRTDLVKEKSSSTPNLRDCKGVPNTQSGTTQRDVKKTTLTYESNTVIESHGYIEVLDEEKNDSCFTDTPGKDIRRAKEDLDSPVYPGCRDSGFSDTDDEEEGLRVYVSMPTAEDSTPQSTPQSTPASTQHTEQVHQVIYTQVQTSVDYRPPLPPKSSHKNNNIKDAFLDYDAEVKLLPEAPPVPIRQTKL